jgi:hypothetical protein
MKRAIFFLICAMLLPVSVFAVPKDTTDVKGMYSGGGVEGELNTAIQAAIDAGTLSNTVFKLAPNDWYVLTGTIEVPEDQTLEIVAPPAGNNQTTAPPQILWTASSSVTKNFLIDVYGNLTLKNVWIRYADAAGIQTGTPIVFDGDTTAAAGGKKQYGTFEGCVFEFMPCPAVTASGSVCVRSKHFVGDFKNCFFRNCTDRHYMYYGRALSFPFDVPGYHTDSVSFENCTFSNMGYVYMQESNNYADKVSFNHCTFYNVVMWPLEYGWWWRLNVNNCLFVNAFMLGYIPAQNPTYNNSATVCITPVDSMTFAVPFTDKDRHILFTHTAYYMDNWLVDWMRGGWEKNYSNTEWRPDPKISTVGNAYSVTQYKARLFSSIPYPRPMLDDISLTYFDSTLNDGTKAFPYINRASLYDVTELRDAIDPGFLVAPLNLDPLKYFLKEKWDTNKDSMWAYMPEAGFAQTWPLPENLAYTNATLKTAGMGGFPLGDLYNWWNPAVREGATDSYSAWLAQAGNERVKIANWLETGNPEGGNAVEDRAGHRIPADLTLNQNYPNPFNPVTLIAYSVPVSGRVSLKVFNALGQEVATVFEGIRQAGKHTASFDGAGIPAGIYFYRLEAEGVTLTKKFVLAK